MVFIAAGDLDHREIVNMAEKQFGNIENPQNSESPMYKALPAFRGGVSKLSLPGCGLTAFGIGFGNFGSNDPNLIPLKILTHMLEISYSFPTTRLANTLIEKKLLSPQDSFHTIDHQSLYVIFLSYKTSLMEMHIVSQVYSVPQE